MRKLILILLLVVGCISAAFSLGMDSTLKQELFAQYLEKGMEHSDNWEFNDAIHCFQKALTYKPGDPLATKMLQLNKERKAELEIEYAIQIMKILEYADKQYALADYEKALNYYERYKKLSGTADRDEKIEDCKMKINEKK